jgi:hypothetical protein
VIGRDLNASISIEQIGIGLESEQALDRAFGVKFEKIKGLLRSKRSLPSKNPKKVKFDISKERTERSEGRSWTGSPVQEPPNALVWGVCQLHWV